MSLIEFPTGLDTETTGPDIWHGCRPFLVGTHDPLILDGPQRCWEWDVDPFTRSVIYPPKTLQSLMAYVTSGQRFVYHNRKFEQRAIGSLGITLPNWDDEDTLVGTHTIRSIGSHRLKDVALEYCDIESDDQEELKQSTILARSIGKQKGWRIAREGDPHFPGMAPKEDDEGWWIFDTWMPRMVALDQGYPKGHPWYDVARRYCLKDCYRNLMVWLYVYEVLHDEGLVPQYIERRSNLEATYAMETRGVPISRTALASAKLKHGLKAETNAAKCFQLTRNPIGVDKKNQPVYFNNIRSPKQLQKVLYNELGLEKRKATKTGYSTDKNQLREFRDEASPNSRTYHFLKSLLIARAQYTCLGYAESYDTFQCPIPGPLSDPTDHPSFPLAQPYWNLTPDDYEDYFLLHPNINTTSTKTTRSASSDPNEQNISKQEEANLREVFCPLPGREFYSFDYSNIEMRIFAYKSEDQELIRAFETGYKVHLLIAEALYPEQWAHCQRNGLDFSVEYESTWYQWVKNGNFALIYGAKKRKADATYHCPGAYEKVRGRFPLIAHLMDSKDKEAKTKGYITTMGGYRLYVPRGKDHAAVNYYIQGSAGWYLIMAMNRIHRYLQSVPDHHMMLTVHDELDFDFPIQTDFRVVRDIADLMEQSGKELGVEVPVSAERHRKSWAHGEKLDKMFPTWRTNPDCLALAS